MLCKWTAEGCKKYSQSNQKRFCSKHYTAWLSIQAGFGGAPVINNDTIGCGEQAGGVGAPAINNDTVGCGEEAGGGGAPYINNNTINHGEQAWDRISNREIR